MTDKNASGENGCVESAEREQADLNQTNTPLYGRGGEREAYREGWYVNAAPPEAYGDGDAGSEYLLGCEEADWRSSKALAALSHPCREVTAFQLIAQVSVEWGHEHARQLRKMTAALSPLPSAVSEDAAVNPMSVSEDKLRKTINGYPRELTGFSTDCRARLQLTVLVEDLNAILGDLETYRRTLAMIGDPPPSAVSEPSGERFLATLSATDLTDWAQGAFEDALPDDASPYEVGKAWVSVGQHLRVVLAEQLEEVRIALSAAPSEPERGGSVASASRRKATEPATPSEVGE